MTAHERLKKDFEEFRTSVMHELLQGRQDPNFPSRLDKIEDRLNRVEKYIFGDVKPNKIIFPPGMIKE